MRRCCMSLLESVQKISEKHNYNGTILISKNQEIRLSAGFGYSNVSLKSKMSPMVKSRIASISKQITAVAIMQLVKQGVLILDESIERFFPTYIHASKITIHHLLSNTSGVANFEMYGEYSDLYKNEDFYASFIKEVIYPFELRFEPGTKFEYSGSGYLMLTSIIEKASKMPYDVYLTKHIFGPLEMNDSGFDFGTNEIQQMAIPYDVLDGEYVDAIEIDLRLGGGGGGLYSTVFDMHKWNMSLLNHTLLPQEYIDKLFTSYICILERTSYGYGLFLTEEEKDGVLEKISYHAGGGPGVQAINVVFLSKNITLTMLSNVNEKKQFNGTRDELYELIEESGIL